ncbi:MAG TPA: ATP-dependent DNA helicase [Bryobacteraceae bacterium]|nr:ATP-dependent DNA helicase [Bryobacteraceae bacterium]
MKDSPMPHATRPVTVRRFFSPHGPLSKWHPNFEFRPGQLEMALEVEAAFNDRRSLIVEAGTGTGKTLAYLVPSILSGHRVIVSTGTKNLQEQLFFKDIPFLQQHFDQPLRVAYMKGRNNYVCRQKVYDAEKEPILAGLEEIADFEIIRDWEKTTETGDRAEIRTLPESSTVWPKLDARREMCTGQKCPQFERCFITRSRQQAASSDIIIVNHHLFFADLAVKEEEYGSIIPDYAAVVFDEAHEIEDVVGQYFGVSVSNYQFSDLRRDIASLARRKGFGSPDLESALQSLDERAAQFFSAFPAAEGRSPFPSKVPAEAYTDLGGALNRLTATLELVPDESDDLIPLRQRLGELAASLRFLIEDREEAYVYWIERRARGCFLQATPIDVASILSERLFSKLGAAILTSATLAVAGSFEYTQKRLGLAPARTLTVAGLFDFHKQALFYVPEHLPEPRNPGYTAQAAKEVRRLLEFSRGRAFALFTSYQQMQQVYDRIAFDLEFPTLLQGTGPRSALLDEFRSTPHCVLFATSSFWQGVDVPGEQLSLVIIDKLPFAVPSDPVVEARIRRIREQGGNPFYDYQIPQAALALKQGFGRLIRSRSDRGVVALLDSRIRKQSYGQVFFDSLPDYSFTTELSDVETFFNV